MKKNNLSGLWEDIKQLALFDFLDSAVSAQNEEKTEVETKPIKPSVDVHPTSLEYRLERSQRKTVGFIVDEKGLTVRAPRWVSKAEIDRMVQERSTWVRKKLNQFSQWQNELGTAQVHFVDGAVLPYLGSQLRIQLGSSIQNRILELEGDGWVLHVNLPKDAEESRVKDWVQVWFKNVATKHFDERIRSLSEKAGVKYHSWSLSSAKGRWGSCSSDRRIRLNWRLMHLKPEIIDYVIAHELAHLSEMNHSPRFWQRVAEIYPEYEVAKKALKGVYIPMLPFEH